MPKLQLQPGTSNLPAKLSRAETVHPLFRPPSSAIPSAAAASSPTPPTIPQSLCLVRLSFTRETASSHHPPHPLLSLILPPTAVHRQPSPSPLSASSQTSPSSLPSALHRLEFQPEKAPRLPLRPA
ncbi:hypothetical protein PANT_7c00290 [Moesziomyces antarcticus T-34]|uniref:Uncharacterized protein n=1 Tax=Pseudozyma antarctica (strain T-34) TaxID=1151754 RepID=M9MBQ7_PSEA3|nr:hypothetical protein PANT_7c00290 [Moesziomyces antarcticus T-34]